MAPPDAPVDSPPDEDPDEEVVRPQKGYVTRLGAEKLHGELLRLLNVERPKITAEVSAAAAQGDRSENAEYLYGKRKLRQIDSRMRFLQRRLDNLTVVDPRDQKDVGRVYFGATVTLEDEDGKTSTYQIVGADELDPKGGRISVDSPVGRALIGKREGDEVLVVRPRGEAALVIQKIRYR